MKSEVSAGGIIYKKENGKTLWLVIKHSGYHKWVFPKGRLENNETPEQAAVREVQEEAGIVAKIIKPLLEVESYTYTFNGEQISKTVQYYLMEYVSGDIADHDWETEDAKWLSAEEAKAILGFPAAKKNFETAEKLFSSLS